MVLDLECVREVLLAVESLGFNDYMTTLELQAKIERFSIDQIEYTCTMLLDGGYIFASTVSVAGYVRPAVSLLFSPTFKGHELLANIRDSKRWKMIKKGAMAVRSYSLSAISALAEGITAGAVATFISGQNGG